MSLAIMFVSGPASGGLRSHLDTLCRELSARGAELRLAAPALTGPLGCVPHDRLELGDRPRLPRDLAAILRLRSLLHRHRPGLVHAHGVKAALVVLAATWGMLRRSRPRVVVTFHNVWGGGLLTLPLRWLAAGIDTAICVSDAVRQSLEAQGIRPRRFRVIPNGIELKPRSPRPPASPGVTVAFLGRLTEEKGVQVLLEAVERLAPNPRLRWMVAGDGPLRPAVEAASARGELQYLGQVTSPDAVYQTAEIVVIPSLSEGQSLVAVEAMAAGIPVVASSVGGLPEVVQADETGILFPAGSAGALEAAVTRLANDPALRARLGAAGRLRAETRFSLEPMLEKTLAVYREVLEAPPPHPGR